MSSFEEPTAASAILPEIGSDPVASVRAGLPYSALEHVREHLEVSDELLGQALGVSSRTLSRRRETGVLTTDESDRLVILAEVVALACQAFDSTDRAREWLLEPHSLLGDESPLEHMDTVTGMEEVKTMLYHIEYSMPA